MWPELSDLSSALILHGFHYYNLEWTRKARNVLSKHNASLRTVTVVQNECFSPRICPPCQYTFSEITLISAYCPFFDETAATRSNPWRITLSHHIIITSALFLPKPFSPRERSWFANGVLYIREIDGACHVFQLVCWETLACNQDNSSLAFWYFICIFYMVIIIKSIKNYSNFIQYWFLTTSLLFFLNIGGIVNSSTVMIYGFSLLHPRNARVLYTDPFIHHLNKPVCLSVEVVVKLFTNWPRSTWTDNVVYQATTRYYEWYNYLGRGIICPFSLFF